MPIQIKVVRTAAGIRNAYTRMPFRFGVITMRAAPMLTLAVDVEDGGGRRATGYAADFLAFRWFDKRPDKSLADNCADLLRTVEVARARYLEAGREGLATPFELWRATYPEIERAALAAQFNRLGASFGASMLERAVIDATGRLTGRTMFDLVQSDALGIELGALSPELRGRRLREFLPERPLERLHVRHTVGLIDPITAADVAVPVADGLPETLEDYLDRDGIGYLKVKVSGALDDDLARLERIAAVLERRARPFGISLDGNEQYRSLDDFLALIDRLKAAPALRRFWRQIMFIEQPLDRTVAMDPDIAPTLQALSREKPVIIDEADGWVSAFREAIALGYRGTSHKNCKGIYKSLHNLALAAAHNQRIGRAELFLSAEDLSNLPVVPLQADLAAVALLGISHVERNGHHYFRGLGHLPEAEKTAALAAHPDLYERRADEVFLEGRGRHAGVRLAPGSRHGLCRAAGPGGDDADRGLGLCEPRPGVAAARGSPVDLIHRACRFESVGCPSHGQCERGVLGDGPWRRSFDRAHDRDRAAIARGASTMRRRRTRASFRATGSRTLHVRRGARASDRAGSAVQRPRTGRPAARRDGSAGCRGRDPDPSRLRQNQPHRRRGIGGRLLRDLRSRATRPLLVGTWAAAEWAIEFSRRHGFELVPREQEPLLLRRCRSIPSARSRPPSCWRSQPGAIANRRRGSATVAPRPQPRKPERHVSGMPGRDRRSGAAGAYSSRSRKRIALAGRSPAGARQHPRPEHGLARELLSYQCGVAEVRDRFRLAVAELGPVARRRPLLSRCWPKARRRRCAGPSRIGGRLPL